MLDTKGSAAAISRESAEPSEGIGARYQIGEAIGRGGMGEVRLARDTRIDREVAVKLLRTRDRDTDTTRFFREARVQGALEHPSVVPVHDLGIDPDRGPYFVMKRLAGTTLSDVLKSEDTTVRARWPWRLLLARLVDICRAIELAHARGVIHRDIKPANIMLGEYGEVYVLDWGLARIATDPDSVDGSRSLPPSPSPGDSGTATGTTLGTPGYMSPEQARGDAVTTATDVFSLALVLFEILAGRGAMPKGPLGVVMTMDTDRHRPSKYARDVPPELDDLCAHATHADPGERPSARAFADAIQAYLDGDRDLARRKELADEHAKHALAALHSADDDESRATAMREAGRAIALDPMNEIAAQVVGRLMLAGPSVIPVEAIASAEHDLATARQEVLRKSLFGYAGVVLICMSMFVLPMRSYGPALAAALVAGAALLVGRITARSPINDDSRLLVVFFALTVTLYVIAGYILGPLLIMPIMLIGAIAAFLAQPSRAHASWITVLSYVLPFVGMLVLEVVGVLPRTVRFEDGAIILTSSQLEHRPISTSLVLAAALFTQVMNTVLVANTRNRAQVAASRALHAQTWHLKQLLPTSDTTKKTG
jgi:tRNA A-37 threonylcarbamoyl transferase component Bud32